MWCRLQKKITPSGVTSLLMYPSFTRSGEYGSPGRVGRSKYTWFYLSADLDSASDSPSVDFLSELDSDITNGAGGSPPIQRSAARGR